MSSEKVKFLTDAVGVAAIVGSLLFVGLQMRQTHEIALVTLYQMRSDAARELLAVQLESEPLLDIETKVTNGGELSDYELQTRSYMPLLIFNHFENSHYLYTSGFLEKEHWSSDLAAIRFSFRTDPNLSSFWEQEKSIFRSSFVEAVDAAVRK